MRTNTGKYYIGSDGRKHFLEGKEKKMQDNTPHGVFCPRCGAEVVPASKINAYRQRTLNEMVMAHKCKNELDKR